METKLKRILVSRNLNLLTLKGNTRHRLIIPTKEFLKQVQFYESAVRGKNSNPIAIKTLKSSAVRLIA